MALQKLPDDIEALINAAKTPTTKKQLADLTDKTDTEIVGIFLKEMEFKPYKRKLLHGILIYEVYKNWNTNPTTMDFKQFIKTLRYWYAAFEKPDGLYFYTRYKGMRNQKRKIKKLLNEQKKQKIQGKTKEQQVS